MAGQEMDTASLRDLTQEQLIELLEANGEGGIKVNFPGKANARKLARRVRPRVVRALAGYNVGTSEAQSRDLVVEGDNLQAMVTLYRERGQVDLILTDPPYNTGNDFRYNDRWEQDPNDPGIGDLVAEDDGARHTKWMRFMYPRLQMMKAMLKPGGVLAICIDQRELFRLGQMLDEPELFGEDNRLAIINWQRSYTPRNDSRHVASTTEYVLVYARSVEKARSRLLPRGEDSTGYESPDGDPRLWTDGPATGSNAKNHKGMVYAIQSPFTGKLLYPPDGSAWRYEQRQNLGWLRGWGCEFELRDLHDADKRAAIIGVTPDEVPPAKGIVLAEPLKAAQKKAQHVYDTGPWPRLYFLNKGRGRLRFKKYHEDLKQGMVPTI